LELEFHEITTEVPSRYPEALQVLKEAAKINGNSLPSDEEVRILCY